MIIKFISLFYEFSCSEIFENEKNSTKSKRETKNVDLIILRNKEAKYHCVKCISISSIETILSNKNRKID